MTDHAERMLKHLAQQMPVQELRHRLESSIASLRGLAQELRSERWPVSAAEVDRVVEMLLPLLGGEK